MGDTFEREDAVISLKKRFAEACDSVYRYCWLERYDDATTYAKNVISELRIGNEEKAGMAIQAIFCNREISEKYFEIFVENGFLSALLSVLIATRNLDFVKEAAKGLRYILEYCKDLLAISRKERFGERLVSMMESDDDNTRACAVEMVRICGSELEGASFMAAAVGGGHVFSMLIGDDDNMRASATAVMKNSRTTPRRGPLSVAQSARINKLFSLAKGENGVKMGKATNILRHLLIFWEGGDLIVESVGADGLVCLMEEKDYDVVSCAAEALKNCVNREEIIANSVGFLRLVTMAKCGNDHTKRCVTELLRVCARHLNGAKLIAGEIGVTALISMMDKGQKCRGWAAEVLGNIGTELLVAKFIAETVGIDHLFFMLENEEENVMECASKVLYTLRKQQDGAKLMVDSIGVVRLVTMLESEVYTIRELAVEVLNSVRVEFGEVKIIVMTVGFDRLISMIETAIFPKTKKFAHGVLQKCASEFDGKRLIIESGGVASLLSLMDRSNDVLGSRPRCRDILDNPKELAIVLLRDVADIVKGEKTWRDKDYNYSKKNLSPLLEGNYKRMNEVLIEMGFDSLFNILKLCGLSVVDTLADLHNRAPDILTQESLHNALHDLKVPEAFINKTLRSFWKKMKVVAIGHGSVGKTTLITAMKKSPVGRIFLGVPSQMASTTGLNQSTIKEKEFSLKFVDFAGPMEYTVTHQFFLSKENTLYLVCFDISRESPEILNNINIWLEYLFHLLYGGNDISTPISSFKVVLVGLKSDNGMSGMTEDLSEKLRTEWKDRLPLHDKIFVVSSHQNVGVSELKDFILSLIKTKRVRQEGNQKPFPFFSWLIQHALPQIRENKPKIVVTVNELYDLLPKDTQDLIQTQREHFESAIEYLHSTGDMVKRDQFVCLDPEVLGHMMASFISPEGVMNRLWVDQKRRSEMGMLTSGEVSFLLKRSPYEDVKTIEPDEALEVMRKFKVCYSLQASEGGIIHMFPSLRDSGIPKFVFPDEMNTQEVQYHGWKFQLNLGVVQQALFCRLLVECCESMEVKKEELELYNNGARLSKISVNYQALVVVSKDCRSIIFVEGSDVNDHSTSLDLVIKNFIASNFTQHKVTTLCFNCFLNIMRKNKSNNDDFNVEDCNFVEDNAVCCVGLEGTTHQVNDTQGNSGKDKEDQTSKNVE